jgi:hypothetical protein
MQDLPGIVQLIEAAARQPASVQAEILAGDWLSQQEMERDHGIVAAHVTREAMRGVRTINLRFHHGGFPIVLYNADDAKALRRYLNRMDREVTEHVAKVLRSHAAERQPLSTYLGRVETISSSVYLLYYRTTLVYVGESTNPIGRARTHRADGKRFDSVAVFDIPARIRRRVESVLIGHFGPPYNRISYY